MGVGVLQPWHVIVILVIVLVIFGPGKLPMLGKAIGDTVRDFKKAVSDEPKPTEHINLAQRCERKSRKTPVRNLEISRVSQIKTAAHIMKRDWRTTLPIHKPIRNKFLLSATPRWSQPKTKPSVPTTTRKERVNDSRTR